MNEIEVNLDQYNIYANSYAKNVTKFNQESIDAYFQHIPASLKNKKLLDLGCGNGNDLLYFKNRKAIIHGLDGSFEMVQLARKANPEGIIEIGSFDKIPFPDQSFDFIVSKWALQTAKSIQPVYEEIIRVLKPNGSLIYLACHPIRQFLEKKKKKKNYFKKEIVKSSFFNGKVIAFEPSHTMNEYLSPFFFEHFTLESFEEGLDSAAEKINNDIYPSYFIIKASLK
jgi:ubiquinone/menaquinone biosynthesis C-methylase UbiE